ncbi:unnamed protein product [Nezara viridula]|uniref:Uncharacterized protein n=1 Tax=Nezara viridula TaxID=85310 RepID=A0A9P0EAF5_NEZVI|nr:unnamed protein product [Nezara viridula]CAH1390306.1 unnamed protein product [Nezara viridula]
MGLAGDYMDYSDLILQASMLGGQSEESPKTLPTLLNATNRTDPGQPADTELEAELFQGYPPSLLNLATLFCLLFMMVGIPGNLITIIALFRCKKVS